MGCLTPEQKQKALRDSVVGEYEFTNIGEEYYKHVYLENGIREYYRNGNNQNKNLKWSIVGKEKHIFIRCYFICYRWMPTKRSHKNSWNSISE